MADLLVHNARIRTMDPARPLAEGLLIRGGRVAALGMGVPPDAVRRIDAGGRLACVAAHAAAKPDLPVVLGAGWQPGIFGDENLTAALLDRVVPDRPVVIYDSSYHNACFNSRALEMAGISDSTPDPVNGHIVRDGAGTALGMLHEEAIPFMVARLPQLGDAHWMAGLLAGQAHANAHGLTGVLDPKITALEARIYARAVAEGRLSLRRGAGD